MSKKKVKNTIPIVLNDEDSLLAKSKKISNTSKNKKKKKEFIPIEYLSEDKNLFAVNGQMMNIPMAGVNVPTVGAGPLVQSINSVPMGMPSAREVAGDALALQNKQAGVATGAVGNVLGQVGAVAGAASGALSGTLGVVDAVKDISTVKDTTEYENSLENIKNETFNAGSTEDFMSQINNKSSVDSISMEALVGTKAENRKAAGKALGSGAAAGATVGSLFGPIGTAIGGAAGALIGGVSALFGNRKKKKEAERKQKQLEEQRKKALAQQQANIEVGANNLQANMASDIMSNYAAYGGLFNVYKYGGIHIKPSKKGTFTAAATKHGKSVQAFANQVLANKEDYSPAMVKKANFAKNVKKWHHEYGGPLFNEFSNGITYINEGGSHEENPYEGIQVGVDPEGIPNMVEEGEVIFNDYVFSDRLKVPNAVRKQYKLRGNKETTFADSAKEITKMSEEMPNDPIVKRTMELRLNDLMNEQEIIRMRKENKRNRYSNGGKVNTYKGGEKLKQWYNDNLKGNWGKIGTGLMQAAPVIGSLAATINDWTGGNEADYSNVENYEKAINSAYKPIAARTLSNYLEYTPYDTSFELNKLAAIQAASRRALLNSSAGNPSAARAAILASDYNYNNQIGDTYRRAGEYNDANRERVMSFNRATDQYNADALSRAAQFNAQLAANKADAIGKASQWREQINQANRAEKSANLTGLLEGISGLGQTFYNQGQLKMLQDNGIIVTSDGKILQVPEKETTLSNTFNYTPYKSSQTTLLDPKISFDMNEVNSKYGYKYGYKRACGGKIKRNRRLS